MNEKILKLPEQEPVDLKMDGALGSVINLAVQTDIVKVALAVLLESRGLEGNWTLQVTAAKLIPVPPKE